jgi:hypothetical protein
MYIKVHKAYRQIIAVCDEDILGKRFEEGKKVLDITKNFFEGEIIEEKELIQLMKDCAKSDASFNIVGEKSINAALESGIVSEEGIKKVQKIPFALTLL